MLDPELYRDGEAIILYDPELPEDKQTINMQDHNLLTAFYVHDSVMDDAYDHGYPNPYVWIREG